MPWEGVTRAHGSRTTARAPGENSNRGVSSGSTGQHPQVNGKPRFIHDGVLYTYEGNVFDKLQDPALYTGTHRNRFDEYGKGRGIHGRDSPSLATGFSNGENRHGDRWKRGLRQEFYEPRSVGVGGPASSLVGPHRSVSQATNRSRSAGAGARGRSHSRQSSSLVMMDGSYGDATVGSNNAPRFEAWALDERGQLKIDERRTFEMNYGPRGGMTQGGAGGSQQWQEVLSGAGGSVSAQPPTSAPRSNNNNEEGDGGGPPGLYSSSTTNNHRNSHNSSRFQEPYQPIKGEGNAQNQISHHDRAIPQGLMQQQSQSLEGNHHRAAEATIHDQNSSGGKGPGFRFQGPEVSLARGTTGNSGRADWESSSTISGGYVTPPPEPSNVYDESSHQASAKRYRDLRRDSERKMKPGHGNNYKEIAIGRSSDDEKVALLEHSEGRRSLAPWEKSALSRQQASSGGGGSIGTGEDHPRFNPSAAGGGAGGGDRDRGMFAPPPPGGTPPPFAAAAADSNNTAAAAAAQAQPKLSPAMSRNWVDDDPGAVERSHRQSQAASERRQRSLEAEPTADEIHHLVDRYQQNNRGQYHHHASSTNVGNSGRGGRNEHDKNLADGPMPSYLPLH